MNLAPPPPRRDYAVIYADPPWTFATYSAKGRGRCADAHYEVMSIEGLKALPVADWAAAVNGDLPASLRPPIARC